jgi:Ca2+/Na+ antiporter
MYWIIPILLIALTIVIIVIAIKEIPPIATLILITVLLFFVYLDVAKYKEVTDITVEDFSTLCDDNVCILRLENKRNITFDKKIDYDLIKSGKFNLYKTEVFDIWGNVDNIHYYIKKDLLD